MLCKHFKYTDELYRVKFYSCHKIKYISFQLYVQSLNIYICLNYEIKVLFYYTVDEILFTFILTTD